MRTGKGKMKVDEPKFPLLSEGGVSGVLSRLIDTQADTGRGGWFANLIPTSSSAEVDIFPRIDLKFFKIFLSKYDNVFNRDKAKKQERINHPGPESPLRSYYNQQPGHPSFKRRGNLTHSTSDIYKLNNRKYTSTSNLFSTALYITLQ